METLIQYYRDLYDAQHETPYCPVKVQGLGMRFNEQWILHREELAKRFDVKLEDIYTKKLFIMAQLVREADANTIS